MVIEDLSVLSKNSTSKQLANSNEILAPSSDRLVAVFFDFLLHFPIFSVFISFFVHKLKLLKWVSESNTESLYVLIQCSIIIFLSVLFFQSIYFKILNFTPGMYLMKLRLRSCNLGRITWEQAFLRSFIWIIGTLFFGIPFLEIFSHKKRKLVHDRASETEVYSLKKNISELSPLAIETSMVQLFFVIIGLASLGWLNTFISMSQNEIESGRMAISEFTERGLLCEEVDEVSKRSHVNIISPEARLEFAASLFMLGQLGEDCLNKELDYGILKKKNLTNRFFVKALISPAYSEDRKKYLELSCQEDKTWCNVGFLIEDSIEQNLRDAVNGVEKNWISSSWTYKVAALKFFNRLGQSELALNVISNLQDDGVQSTGLIEQQVRALQRLNRQDEVMEVLRGVRSVVIEKDFARLNSEICLQSLDAACVQDNFACKNFIGFVNQNKDILSETGPSRTVFKYFNCNKKLNENLEFWSLIENEDIQEMVQWTMYLEQSDTKSAAISKLRNFVEDQSRPQNLRWDALQILLKNTNYDKDWELATIFWKEFSPYNDSYLSASNWLLREAKLQNKENQIEVISKVLNANPGISVAEVPRLKAHKAFRLPAEAPKVMEK